MELRERIASWAGWRTYGPAAGSAVTHAAILAMFASMLAASGGERMPPSKPPAPAVAMEVTLVAEALPPEGTRPTPPDPQRAPPKPPAERPEVLPEAPPVQQRDRKDQKQQQQASTPTISGGAVSDDDGGVYLGDSALADSGVPLGLRGLLETDPCSPKYGPKRGDCGTRWDQRIGMNPFLITPSEAELKRMYPGIIPPCPYKVGCERGEWISTNGTRSVMADRRSPFLRNNPMAGGAARLGGANEIVPRLGFNPDHVDPGFGD